FFYIVGHGIDQSVQEHLELQSKLFFAQDIQSKMNIRMALGGIAWRGYFPVGDELTSGKPDRKEGLYFGTELNENDPNVQARLPLHGPNLFPPDMPDFKRSVLDYIAAMTRLGHQVMEGLALSLGLEASYFARHYTGDPLCLFRIFHYPPAGQKQGTPPQWGVGEHTDYGLLTILKQDNSGGLQIKTKGRWVAAPVVPDSFICNIGDMLDRMTGGYYRSTPHRVLNTTGNGRLSYPFFFDPNFNAEVRPVPLTNATVLKKDDKTTRWDKASVHDFQGTYGDYILTKIAKVFPELKKVTDTTHSRSSKADFTES
ncbi:MAG: 2OG-Fe(II) oxygenase family protein, partial [Bacteroidota bacterium]